MALTKDFMDAVESRKIIRVRIMLKDIMLVDPTMKMFDEMMEYASAKLDNLFDEYDGETLKYDSSEWNEAYLNEQMVVVVNNFSKERIELLRNIVKYLYRAKADRINSETENKAASNITRRQIGTGVTIAGAAVAIAGVCMTEGLAIAGGVALAATGVLMIATDKE